MELDKQLNLISKYFLEVDDENKFALLENVFGLYTLERRLKEKYESLDEDSQKKILEVVELYFSNKLER